MTRTVKKCSVSRHRAIHPRRVRWGPPWIGDAALVTHRWWVGTRDPTFQELVMAPDRSY